MKIDYCQRFGKYGGKYLLVDKWNDLAETQTGVYKVNHKQICVLTYTGEKIAKFAES